MTTDLPADSTAISPAAQRTVLTYSVLIGLCPLIPVPFLDEFVLGVISRRMIRTLLGLHELSSSEDNIQRLSRERVGCPLGCLYSLLLAPIKKMVRTLVFVLAFKDCVDAASRWLHRGFLLSVALEKEVLSADQLGKKEGVWPVALAIEEAIITIDTSPINQMVLQVFSHSRALLRSTARDLYRRVRPHRRSDAAAEVIAEVADDEKQALSSVVEELSDAFWAKRDYLSVLEATFWQKLEQTTARMQVSDDA